MKDRRDRIPANLFGGIDDDVLHQTYLDRKPFKDYCREVADVIHAADHALCTREIHLALGKRAQVRWTADALVMIRSIEAVGILPTRYRPVNRPDIPLIVPAKEPLALIFAK